MLNQNLIDVINSEESWAFVGSGCSIDSGLPSWSSLLDLTAKNAESALGLLPKNRKEKIDACKNGKIWNIPEAFSILKSYYGNSEVEGIVSTLIKDYTNEPGEITKMLAAWPFASYITTNYDNLIESAVESFGGWVSVGNTADENAKISRDIKKVVWHPHGGVNLGDKNLRLVLSSSDYNEMYPSGSPTLDTLKAVFRMKRIIFVGFGFNDHDLMIALENIGRFTTPARPAFAFIGASDQRIRQKFWEQYNIEIIPYASTKDNHSDLINILKLYGAFVLDRTCRFGHTVSTPDYDIETVGLLTHNRLCRQGWVPGDNATKSITRGLVITQLRLNSSLSIENIISKMPLKTTSIEIIIREVIDEFIGSGTISQNGEELVLTDKGKEIARQGHADYEIAREQFKNSINSRVYNKNRDAHLVENVRDVTVSFFERMCRERGLGVAQQLVETGDAENRARSVALLQGAKSDIKSAINRTSALLITQCIQDVISGPSDEEKRYLGLYTQAYFGRHLLGIDPSAIAIQQNNLSSTVFIADSNYIIPLIAEGSLGHQYAQNLYMKLNNLNCRIVTSDLLLVECNEHARWAWKLLREHGSVSSATIDAVRGARGYRQNAFLTGYLNHTDFGPGISFRRYFARIFDSSGDLPNEDEIAESLRKKGIIVQSLTGWQGFKEEFLFEQEKVQVEIERRRRNNLTYTHDRQVKAEAEVAVIITNLRKNILRIDDNKTMDAFFLSNSRVIDNLPLQAHKVCMTPEALFEWILSIGEISKDDANAIFDQLLWDLAKEGINIVPRKELLHLFHNTIDASKTKLSELISEYRELIREKYAADPEEAFKGIDPLSLPNVADEISISILKSLSERLKTAEQKAKQAEKIGKNKIDDYKEYVKLKEEKRQRKRKARKRELARKSNPKRRKRNRKNKK